MIQKRNEEEREARFCGDVKNKFLGYVAPSIELGIIHKLHHKHYDLLKELFQLNQC